MLGLWGRSVGGACLAALLLAAGAVTAGAEARDLAFDVYREGKKIGQHTVRFEETAQGTVAEVKIELNISLLFISVYRYSHRNRELWRDGRLVMLDTQTDDNGTAHRVEGRDGPDGFKVTSGNGWRLLPSPPIPTSYWNKEFVRQERVLNTQTGESMAIRAEPLGEESILAGGRNIPARHYRIEGELRLDVWYDAAGQLAKLSFRALSDGSLIDYVLRPAGPLT